MKLSYMFLSKLYGYNLGYNSLTITNKSIEIQHIYSQEDAYILN